MSNLAEGMCLYAQCQIELHNNPTPQAIVGYYGDGKNSPSTYEILEYRDQIFKQINN